MGVGRVAGRAGSGRAPGVCLDSVLVRQLRAELALTQTEAADLAGTTSRTLQTAEAGGRVAPASARAIARALGTSYGSICRPDGARLRAVLATSGLAPLAPPSPWGARERETETVLHSLRGAGERIVCCLTGPSGVGKTALARFVASRLADELPYGIAWVTASRNASRERATATMLHLAEALGFHTRLADPGSVEPEAFAASFRSMFWSRRRLLVLDDVESLEDAWRFLGRNRGCLALLTTTRRSVAHALGDPTVTVGPLTPEAAAALLAAHLGPERTTAADPTGTAQLVAFLGGIPRALAVAAGVLAEERYTTPGDYARRLVTSEGASTSTGAPETETEDALFSVTRAQLLRRLSPEHWQLMGALSVFEDRPFSVRWAAAVSPHEAHPERGLAALVDAYLLEELWASHDSTGSVASPPRLRFAFDAQALRAARAVAGSSGGPPLGALLAHARKEARALSELAPEAADTAFSADLEVWMHCLEAAARSVLGPAAGAVASSLDDVPPMAPGADPEAAHLPEILRHLHGPLLLRLLPEGGTWYTAGLAAARKAGDRVANGRLSVDFGRWWCGGPGEFARATPLCRAGATALVEAGEPEEAVFAMFMLAASVYGSRGPGPALEVNRETLDLAERAGLSKLMRGRCLFILGSTLAVAARTRVQWAEAVAALERAISLLPGSNDIVRIVRSAALVNLAVLRRAEGRGRSGPEIDEALGVLAEIATEEPIDALRVEWLRRHLRRGRAESRAAAIGPARLHEAILAVPSNRLARRVIKLAELASFAYNPMFAPPVTGKGGVPGRIALSELAHGSPVELRLRHSLMLLYPVEMIDQIVDDRAAELAIRFARRTLPEGHQLRVAIELLAVRGARSVEE